MTTNLKIVLSTGLLGLFIFTGCASVVGQAQETCVVEAWRTEDLLIEPPQLL